MSYTSDAQVKSIADIDDAIDTTPFIETAHALVVLLCEGDKGPDPAYDAAHLELIERWLAAHFYHILDMRAASEKAGSVAISYQHEVDLLLHQTMYGQQAMILDVNGGLANHNKEVEDGTAGRKGAVNWLGTTKT